MDSIALLAPKYISLQSRVNTLFTITKLPSRFPLITIFPCKPAKLIPLKAKTNLICDHNQEINRKYKKLPLSEWTHRFHSVNIDISELDELTREIDVLKPRVKNTLMSIDSTKKRILMIYLLVSLGVAYHFEDEIDETLKDGFENIEEMMDDSEDDLYTVSIIFFVFRTYGYNISSGMFNKFKDETGKFKNCLSGDAKGLLSLHEAAHLRTTKDYILDEALSFTMDHLKSLATTSGACPIHLSKHIQNALHQPQHWNMEILVAMEYIPFYEQEEDRDETLLKFAKLNFKLTQLCYLQELKMLTKWYKELGLAYMLPPYFRDRIVENYFYILAVYLKPQLSFARVTLAQYFTLLGILDDTCDRYASLAETESLTKSLERWGPDSTMEKQPDYIKFAFNCIMDTFKEFEKDMESDGRCYNVKATIEEFKILAKANREFAEWAHGAELPSFEDFIEVGVIEVTASAILAAMFMAMAESASEEAYEWLKSRPKMVHSLATKGRLLNDLTGFQDDTKRGYMPTAVNCYMKQYGVTKEEAFKKLYKMISDFDKTFNEDLLTTNEVPRYVLKGTLDLARMIYVCYNGIEGFTNPEGKIKEYMNSLLIDLIHL